MVIPAFFLANELQKMYQNIFFSLENIYNKYVFLGIATCLFFVLNMLFLDFIAKILKKK